MFDFRVSSFCNFGGCVEVGRSEDGTVLLRDTKDRSQPPIESTVEEFGLFLAEVKAGKYDPV
jgi:hypothetical protein